MRIITYTVKGRMVLLSGGGMITEFLAKWYIIETLRNSGSVQIMIQHDITILIAHPSEKELSILNQSLQYHKANAPSLIIWNLEGRLTHTVYSVNELQHREQEPSFITWHSKGTVKRLEFTYLDKFHRDDGLPALISWDSEQRLTEAVSYTHGKQSRCLLDFKILP